MTDELRESEAAGAGYRARDGGRGAARADARRLPRVGRGRRLHGRFVHALDDLEDLLRRADEIVRDDLYVMRLRKPG